MIDNFFLAKFSSDFKTIGKTMMIASDLRYFQYGGDAWMANGITGSATANRRGVMRPDQGPGTLIHRAGSMVTVAASGGVVRLTDPQGRLVRQWVGSAIIATKELDAGAYVVTSGSGRTCIAQRLTVAR